MKNILAVVAFASLFAGCATSYNRPYTPIVDFQTMPAEKSATYAKAEQDCRQMAQQRLGQQSWMSAMAEGESGPAKRQSRFEDTMRRCLQGRGIAVVN